MTKEKVNPVAHEAGKHRKGSGDAHVPPTRQAQSHTEVWKWSPHVRGKWQGAEALAGGSGRDTTLPSCLRSLELPPQEREQLVTTGGELFPICLCSSEWRGSTLHQNNPIEQNDSY